MHSKEGRRQEKAKEEAELCTGQGSHGSTSTSEEFPCLPSGTGVWPAVGGGQPWPWLSAVAAISRADGTPTSGAAMKAELDGTFQVPAGTGWRRDHETAKALAGE